MQMRRDHAHQARPDFLYLNIPTSGVEAERDLGLASPRFMQMRRDHAHPVEQVFFYLNILTSGLKPSRKTTIRLFLVSLSPAIRLFGWFHLAT